MPSPHILLADDEPDILWALTHGLSGEGYVLHTAPDGVAAMEAIERIQPDLALLDVTMPQVDGLEVCRRIRQSSQRAHMAVLILTARKETAQLIEGLDCGADDYVAKPFNLGELRARIRALLRRSNFNSSAVPNEEHMLVVGDLALNLHSHEFKVGNRPVNITPIEFCLLRHLMRHPDEVFSTRYLLEHVLNYPRTDDPGIIRWHMKNLRSKIEHDPQAPRYLCTLPHHGYIVRSNYEAACTT